MTEETKIEEVQLDLESEGKKAKREHEAERKRLWRAKQKLKPNTEEIRENATTQEETSENKIKEEVRGHKELRVKRTFTIDRQLNEELIKKAQIHRLSLSRYVEITLRKALRL